MDGPDVALLQRDLNVWYAFWGAPASQLLDRDGELGDLTELAFRRARKRLGLPLREHDDKLQMIVRDRLIVRHIGRLLAAEKAGKTYEVPAGVKRTDEEIERGKATREWERDLIARFKRMNVERKPEIVANVSNQSSRNGRKPRIIVLHTTEGHNRPGLSDLQGLVSMFDNPATQASSHIGNDAEGNDARMVPDDRKAWTQAQFNPIALSIEQIGFAADSGSMSQKQLANTAAWIAHWSRKYDIPIRHSTTHGVCQHRDLGAAGGGHSDCGPAYPFNKVLSMAKELA
jgi:hypothetical protein